MPTTRAGQRAAGLRRLIALAIVAALAVGRSAQADDDGQAAPIAGAFVYPVGNELDYTKPHEGETSGFHVSDGYLVVRTSRKGQRIHRGVDLADGRGGEPVRAVASGVVVVADANALVKTVRKQRIRTHVLLHGKRVARTATRLRTAWKWRTGWGNYVVIRHTLPNGETVFSLYAHLKPKSIRVRAGDVVSAGQPIALIGHTGRATSSHLHLEIRKSLPADPGEEGGDEDVADAEAATVQDRSFAKLATVDPVSFLEQHVRTFDDLDPGTWEARYALAACRDGLIAADGDRFEPERGISRAAYYRALVAAFHLATPFTTETFESSMDALVDSGILDKDAVKDQEAGDPIPRSEALEILLRCLDKKPARGPSLGAVASARLREDFNRVFAGEEAAAAAEKEAREAARAQTLAKRKAADEEYARALKAAKAKGAGATRHRRVKRAVVKPVAPVITLDPGFEKLAKSDQKITRAEACLLLASALRISSERVSALERAAARVASAASSG